MYCFDLAESSTRLPNDQLWLKHGVEGAKGASCSRDLAFMVHHVAGQRGVIGFQVEFEVFEQPVFAQKVSDRLPHQNRIDAESG
jgi:hypothetical protein